MSGVHLCHAIAFDVQICRSSSSARPFHGCQIWENCSFTWEMTGLLANTYESQSMYQISLNFSNHYMVFLWVQQLMTAGKKTYVHQVVWPRDIFVSVNWIVKERFYKGTVNSRGRDWCRPTEDLLTKLVFFTPTTMKRFFSSGFPSEFISLYLQCRGLNRV